MHVEELDIVTTQKVGVTLIPKMIKFYDENMGLCKGIGSIQILSKGKSEDNFYDVKGKSNITFTLEKLMSSGPIPYGQLPDGTYSKSVDPAELLSMIAGAIDKAYRGEYTETKPCEEEQV